MERSEIDSIAKEIDFETNLFYSTDRNEIRDHLKKLKQIKRELKKDPKAVSYTHLTLPTIYSV